MAATSQSDAGALPATAFAPAGAARCSAHWLRPADVTSLDEARWRRLAERASDANPFLLPEFVLAAARHLPQSGAEQLLVVIDNHSHEWLALGSFEPVRASRSFPLPHLVGSRSRHAFRTGLLLDRDRPVDAVDCLLPFLKLSAPGLHGLEFDGLRLDARLVTLLAEGAVRHRMDWATWLDHRAPAVLPAIVIDDYLERKWSASRRKSLRRSRARAEALGPITLRQVTALADLPAALQTFCNLEAGGWKGDAGTACASSAADVAFLEQMATGLALSGNLLITELCAGERVLTSAINLLHNGELFAFKIGWDAGCASFGPGILHEAELVQQSPGCLSQLALFDSCSRDDAYIGSVWPERLPIGMARLTWSPWGARLASTVRTTARFIRDACAAWQK